MSITAFAGECIIELASWGGFVWLPYEGYIIVNGVTYFRGMGIGIRTMLIDTATCTARDLMVFNTYCCSSNADAFAAYLLTLPTGKRRKPAFYADFTASKKCSFIVTNNKPH